MVAFADLVRQGKVGYLGVSEWTVPQIEAAAGLAAAAAVGVRLTPEILKRVDDAFVDPDHGDLVERDPGKIATPFDVRPGWRRD